MNCQRLLRRDVPPIPAGSKVLVDSRGDRIFDADVAGVPCRWRYPARGPLKTFMRYRMGDDGKPLANDPWSAMWGCGAR